MDDQLLRDEIRDLISRNKTDKAFELLSNAQFNQVDKQLIILSSQYNRIKEELRLNVISKDEGERRINQINLALLDISYKMDSTRSTATVYGNVSSQKQSFNPKLLWLLLIPCLAFLIFWGINRDGGQQKTADIPTHTSITEVEKNQAETEKIIPENTAVEEKVEPQKPTPASPPVIDILKLNSLVAYYPLDGHGIDKKNGYNATAITGVQPQEGRKGNRDGAFYFDGKESRIELPVLLNSQNNNLSISVWIKTLNNVGFIWGQFTKSATTYIGNNHYMALIKNSIIHDNYPPSGGSAKLGEVPSNRIPTNTWTHVVISRNSSSIKLYINGQQIADRPETEIFETKDWGDVAYSVIGVRPRHGGIQSKDSFNGWIDDLLIFNSGIDAKTAANLYELDYNY